MNDAARSSRVRGDGTLWLPKGSTIYWGTYYLNGKPQPFSTRERDEKRARKVLRARVAAVTTGHAVPESGRRFKYDDLEAGLVTHYEMHGRRSLKDMPRVFARLRAAFAGQPALSIMPAAGRAYAAARLAESAKPATINKEIAALNRMRNLAAQDGLLPPQVPIPKLSTDNARRGFLDPADFETFCSELPAYLRPAARFAYNTGWRKGEVFTLTWAQIDLTAGTIRLENDQTKTGLGRTFAFASDDEVAGLLRDQHERRRVDCPFVFHRNGRQIRDCYHAWRAAAKRAGRPGLYLHDFRRSTARNLIRAGVPERVAMSVTGHKTRSIFDRYNIVSEADLRAATATLSEYMKARRKESTKVTALRVSGGESSAACGSEPSKNHQSAVAGVRR
jgi:integrase